MSVARIELRAPVWGNGRAFGIAGFRMAEPVLSVSCTYEDKQGERLFPHRYIISREKAMTFPQQTVKGTTLYVIPVAEFTEAIE